MIYFAKTADLSKLNKEQSQFDSAQEDVQDYKKMDKLVKVINNADHSKMMPNHYH